MEFKPFDIDQIDHKNHSLWRYKSFIPLENTEPVTLGEGFTNMMPIILNNKTVWIKQEHLFPSGSYKDRGATVLITDAYRLGVKHVVQDSSGNAGCAIAAYAAKAGISCDIYVPANTSPAKLVQLQMYGAKLKLINGTREDVAHAAKEAAQHSYYASHCYNELFWQGTKTFAYEIAEQLGWQCPDVVVLPAGNGTLLIGAYLGFKHLKESGITSKLPKLVAIQSENCAPLYQTWKSGSEQLIKVSTQPTLAEGIAISEPYRWREMLHAVNETNGLFITVTEAEISSQLRWCANNGYYIEPTSAATIAGLIKCTTLIDEAIWVSLFSGHGLKSTEKLAALLG